MDIGNKHRSKYLQLEDVYPPLFMSVEARNIDHITSLIEKGADVNGITNNKLTPMHSISGIISFFELCNLMRTYGDTILLYNYKKTFFVYNETRNLKIAELLLKHGASVNVQANNDITPLHIAAGSGSIKMVTLLLNNGADINSLTRYGETALHYAVSVKDINMCKLLLEHKIDVNVSNRSHVTALHISVELGDYEIMKLLLKYGADPNIVSFYPSDIRQIEENEDSRLTRYLRDVKVLNANNFKLLHDYMHSSLNDSRRCSACSKLILNPSFECCISPLIFLCRKGCVDEVDLLLEDYKADPNIRGRYYCSPLHYAISERQLRVVKSLINNGADVNTKDLFRNTPSHYACNIMDNDSFIRFLIENDAKIEEKNADGKTPLHVACKLNNIPIIKILISRGVSTNLMDIQHNSPLQYAIENDCEEVVKLLLESKANPNLCMDMESSPIVLAIKNNNKSIIKLLLNAGANVKFINNYDILHTLARVDNTEMLKFLISVNGIDLNKIDKDGFPLAYYISKLYDTSIMESILLGNMVDLHKIIGINRNAFTMILEERESVSKRMLELILSYVSIQINCRNHIKGLDVTKASIESNNYINEIYESCRDEILRMEKIKLSDKYTLIDVYEGRLSIGFLAKRYLIFSDINIQESFPIYGRYLERYLKASIKRQRIIQSAISSLDEIVSEDNRLHSWNKLPFEIRLSIVELIESKDLIDITHPDTICRLSLETTFH
ncbi:ankyrin repeat protein [Fowlpox virus]|nr:ankyrin repeat protein [Fowlpox virus]